MSSDSLPPREVCIEPVKVAEFIRAIGVDPEPGYVAAAGAPVPPGYLTYASSYDPVMIHDRVGFDPLRTLYAGVQLEIFHVPILGDVLTVTPSIGDVRTVQGSSGALRLADVEVDYHQGGKRVMREISTVAERSIDRG